MAGTTEHTTADQVAEHQRSSVIHLDESLDVTTLETLHRQLRKVLHAGQPLVIDGSRVQHVDGAALQLLCALRQDALARNATLRWRKVSPVIRDAAGVSGLSCFMGLSPDPDDSL